MTAGQEVIEDYLSPRLSLRAHPMELLRPRLPESLPHDRLPPAKGRITVTVQHTTQFACDRNRRRSLVPTFVAVFNKQPHRPFRSSGQCGFNVVFRSTTGDARSVFPTAMPGRFTTDRLWTWSLADADASAGQTQDSRIVACLATKPDATFAGHNRMTNDPASAGSPPPETEKAA